MSKPKSTQWRKPLPNQVKAEILGSVFHLLTSHERKAFARVPKWLRKQMSQVMFDCAVDHYDLSRDDIKLLRVYLDWLEAKHPRAKKRKTRQPKPPVNDMAMRDFLYNKESSGR